MPRGVHGWLLFFICTLVFVTPATYIFSLLEHYSAVMGRISRLGRPAPHYVLYLLEELFLGVLCIYGIFSGVLLWKLRPAGVRHAKDYMLAMIAFRVIDFCLAGMLVIFAAGPRGLRLYLAWRSVLPVVGSVIYAAIWYSYLVKSNRVRLTYFPEHSPETRLANASG